jgi:hypothetical protein
MPSFDEMRTYYEDFQYPEIISLYNNYLDMLEELYKQYAGATSPSTQPTSVLDMAGQIREVPAKITKPAQQVVGEGGFVDAGTVPDLSAPETAFEGPLADAIRGLLGEYGSELGKAAAIAGVPGASVFGDFLEAAFEDDPVGVAVALSSPATATVGSAIGSAFGPIGSVVGGLLGAVAPKAARWGAEELGLLSTGDLTGTSLSASLTGTPLGFDVSLDPTVSSFGYTPEQLGFSTSLDIDVFGNVSASISRDGGGGSSSEGFAESGFGYGEGFGGYGVGSSVGGEGGGGDADSDSDGDGFGGDGGYGPEGDY